MHIGRHLARNGTTGVHETLRYPGIHLGLSRQETDNGGQVPVTTGKGLSDFAIVEEEVQH